MSKKQATRGRARKASPPPLSSHDSASDAESDHQSLASLSHDSPIKKKSRVLSHLEPEDEEVMVEWLRENPILYNKKMSSYKDKNRKDSLWDAQAARLVTTAKNLTVWYRSIRTRYGRLAKKKSGVGAERTDRDKWIFANFDFLKNHIHEVQPRTVVSVSKI
jgi:hypothetical protein